VPAESAPPIRNFTEAHFKFAGRDAANNVVGHGFDDLLNQTAEAD
jgi:hypothetical protein